MIKALVIHPKRIEDTGNLLGVARSLGRKAFRTDGNVRVHPWVRRIEIKGVNYFVVVVEEMSCTTTQEQGKDDVGA